MKSVKVILLFLLSSMYVAVNAQVFVSGSLGYSSTGGSTDNGTIKRDKNSVTNFNFSPAIGTFISEEIAIGLKLSYGSNKTINPNNDSESTSSSFGLAPFLRYYVYRINNFSVFGQGEIGFASSSSKVKMGIISADGPKGSTFRLNIFPGLSYDLGQKISLETSINLLNVGYYSNTEKDGNSKETTTGFNFGSGLHNIVNSGNISIGAIYKF